MHTLEEKHGKKRKGKEKKTKEKKRKKYSALPLGIEGIEGKGTAKMETWVRH